MSHSFCFTINNYTDDDLADVVELGTISRYLLAGFEVGEEGTPHIQGYVYMDDKYSIRQLVQHIGRAHIEVCKGSPQQNIKYCTKSNDYYEVGTAPCQGRASWNKVKETMADPKSNWHLYVQYNKAYKSYKLQKYISKQKVRRVIAVSPDDEDELYSRFSSTDLLVIEGFDTISAWNGEKAIYFAHVGIGDYSRIKRWKLGHPTSITRGYEVIKIDPEVIYIRDDVMNQQLLAMVDA